MNLPVGILALILVYQLVEDPPYLTRARALGKRVSSTTSVSPYLLWGWVHCRSCSTRDRKTIGSVPTLLSP